MTDTTTYSIRGGKNNPLLFNKDFEVNYKDFDRPFMISVCNLFIFNSNGEIVFETKSLKNFGFEIKDEKAYISFEDVHFIPEVYSLFTQKENKELSDYEVALGKNRESKLTYNLKPSEKYFKLVTKSDLRNNENKQVGTLIYNFPKVTFDREASLEMDMDAASISTTEIYLIAHPDSEGNLFEIIRQ